MISHVYWVICWIMRYLCTPIRQIWHKTGPSEEWFNWSQSENEMKEHSLHLPSYHRQRIPMREQRFYTMSPLSSIYFCHCIWGGDKPVLVTHRPTHNTHCWTCDADIWEFDAVLAGLQFYLLHHMIYPPLLTSNNAWVCIREKDIKTGEMFCIYLQMQIYRTFCVHLPSTNIRGF